MSERLKKKKKKTSHQHRFLPFFPGRIQLWGHPIAVDWAEPEVEVDEDTMATVKILYVRNLMLPTTEETIEKEFNSIKPGEFTKIRSLSNILDFFFRSVLLCKCLDFFLLIP